METINEMKSEFLNMFLHPLYQYGIEDVEYQRLLSKRLEIFREDNKDLPFDEFMQKAKNEYGKEVEYISTYRLTKKVNGIHAMLKFFTIITVLSLIVGIILALMHFMD